MKQELTDKLYAKYPVLFRGEKNSKQMSLMPFGIECGDGWYDLIDDMCEDLTWVSHLDEIQPLFFLIKEKFGGLRVHINSFNRVEEIIVNHYESKSYHICEECGKEGHIRNTKSWLSTLCNAHAYAHGYALNDSVAKDMGLKVGEYVSLEDLRATAKSLGEFK